MKIKTYARFFGLVLSVSVASVSASETVSVQASSDLRVSVIDNSKDADSQAPVHAALQESLSAGMTRECKGPVAVSLKLSDARRAAKDLSAGDCDVVIVIGNSVPAILMKDGVNVLKATDARSGSLNRTFYLLAHGRDPAMNKMVALAFDHAVKSSTFQDALVGKENAAPSLAASSVR